MPKSSSKPKPSLPSEGQPRMSREQAAAYLGVSAATLSQDIVTQRHKFPYIKIGRRCIYDRALLDTWIKNHSEHAS